MNVYDTINYIDYGLMGIILILLMGMLCMYRELIDAQNHKEHWKIIALEKERLHKVLDNAKIVMEERLDKLKKLTLSNFQKEQELKDML